MTARLLHAETAGYVVVFPTKTALLLMQEIVYDDLAEARSEGGSEVEDGHAEVFALVPLSMFDD